MERDATQRTAYLDEVCAHDLELRHEVSALLAANKRVEHFLTTPAFELAAKEQAQEIAAEPSLLITGQIIGHYRVLSRLGVGGMGEVWLAEDNALRRRVALKLLLLEFTANEDRVRRFQQEARAASALNHPNIITIYEIGESGNLHFIATEFIEGVTLRQRIAAGKFTMHEAIGIAVQSANAIDAAHRADIVHRDIKPENIMLRPDGLVKVLDFGLARITAQTIEVRDETLVADVRTESGVLRRAECRDAALVAGWSLDRFRFAC